jgi:hypothetical protein
MKPFFVVMQTLLIVQLILTTILATCFMETIFPIITGPMSILIPIVSFVLIVTSIYSVVDQFN